MNYAIFFQCEMEMRNYNIPRKLLDELISIKKLKNLLYNKIYKNFK